MPPWKSVNSCTNDPRTADELRHSDDVNSGPLLALSTLHDRRSSTTSGYCSGISTPQSSKMLFKMLAWNRQLLRLSRSTLTKNCPDPST